MVTAVLLESAIVQLTRQQIEWLLTLRLVSLQVSIACHLESTTLATFTSTRDTGHKAHLLSRARLLDDSRRLSSVSLVLLRRLAIRGSCILAELIFELE